MSLFTELKRRNVVRVGFAYLIVGWVIAQVAEFALENFGAPEWVLKSFVTLLLLGLPLALFFAWAFELTPDGVKLEKDVDRSQSITGTTGRKLDYLIIAAFVIALGYFVWERQSEPNVEPTVVQSAATKGGATVPGASEPESAGPNLRSIAVLPFVNMSSDEEQEWFSDGLTEEILNALARTPDLLVAARTSSFKFKGSNEDVPTIANALGVAHVLEGSVRRGGDQLRVTAQLIRASDGFHLWSQTYDRKPEDVISVQEDIAVRIATALETAMDPEALEQMMSSGTSSIPAYNAYLKGLAFGISTASTSDPYEYHSARYAFEEAIELDPDFALAHWELAQFWNSQLGSTYVISGKLNLSNEEMRTAFDEAIDNAIRTEKDPLNRMRYGVTRDMQYLRLDQALRANTDYLEQRPNDQIAHQNQLDLLSSMSRDKELRAAIETFQERDGYDVFVVNTSMTDSLVSDDKEFIRAFAQEGMRRLGDSPFVQYQAHRALLWAGDVDGASLILRMLQASDLPDESRGLVDIRQACAENRVNDASRIFDRLRTKYLDDTSIIYISSMIMNNKEAAIEVLRPLDTPEGLDSLADYLNYAYFDARAFPNLMTFLESEGITPREPREIPYRCNI